MSATVGDPLVNLGVFAVFVSATLAIVVLVAGRNPTASDYFAAGRTFGGRQNGIAIGGDYLSAASFLGIAGAIALGGYDGFLYSVGFGVGWLVVLLLVAEPLRNTGKYTLADVLAYRLRHRGVRAVAAASTLVVSLLYLLAQMAGAGALVSLLLGVTSPWGRDLTIVVVGLLMVFYVLVGGMKGTTWVQIVKAVLLLVAAVVLAGWVLARAGWDPSALLHQSAQADPRGDAVLRPGLVYGHDATSRTDFVSLSLALVLGVAGLPHVLMRLYTVPDAREARRSVVWATWIVGAFYLCTLVLGFGAMWIVGRERILSAPGRANAAVPLLAYELGGTLLLAVVASVAFATILAVVAGLTITASASFAHDVYAGLVARGSGEPGDGAGRDQGREVLVARVTAVVVGVLAVLGGVAAKDQNVAFLVGLAFAVAASANLPAILYALYWPRFTARGAVWSISGGLVISVGLILASPVVWAERAPFPLVNPGIVSIPLAFALGWLGSVTGPSADPRRFARVEVRGLTAAGAVRARTRAAVGR